MKQLRAMVWLLTGYPVSEINTFNEFELRYTLKNYTSGGAL